MKNGFQFLLSAAVALVTASAALAAEKPFSLAIGENDSLVIFAPDGKQVATLPTATVGKTVNAPPYSFQVSYGKDANGNLSVIITPNPDHPTALTFTFANREVAMDRTSVVTLTLADGGRNVIIDPGYTGSVKVDGKVTTVATNSNGTPATAATLAAASPGAGAPLPGQVPSVPAQQPPAPAGSGSDDLANLPGVALAPLINNSFAAVYSPKTDPADTTPVGRGPG